MRGGLLILGGMVLGNAFAAEPEPLYTPELSIAGSASGSSTLEVGYLRTQASDWSARVDNLSGFDFSAKTSDGAASLFSDTANDKKPAVTGTTWSIGGQLGVQVLSPLPVNDQLLDRLLEDEKRTAAQRCEAVRACPEGSTEPACVSAGEERQFEYEATLAKTIQNHVDQALGHTTEPSIVANPNLQTEDLTSALRSPWFAPGASLPDACSTDGLDAPISEFMRSPPENRLGKTFDLGKAWAKVIKDCAAACEGSNDRETDAACTTVRAFSATLPNLETITVDPRDVDAEAFCEAGRQHIYESAPNKLRLAMGRFPALRVLGGARIGFVNHSFLSVSEDAITQDASGSELEDPIDSLAQTDSTAWSATAGGIAVWIPPGPSLSFELRGYISSSTTASVRSAEWCQPVGIVGTSVTSPSAQACTTRPLGSPTRSTSYGGEFYLGGIERQHGLGRVAVGVRYERSNPQGDDDDGTYSVAGRFPIRVNTLALPRTQGKIGFEGIIAITPWTQYTQRLDGNQIGEERSVTSAGVDLSLTVSRSLFSTRFDRL